MGKGYLRGKTANASILVVPVLNGMMQHLHAVLSMSMTPVGHPIMPLPNVIIQVQITRWDSFLFIISLIVFCWYLTFMIL